jgi:hypothetical protein
MAALTHFPNGEWDQQKKITLGGCLTPDPSIDMKSKTKNGALTYCVQYVYVYVQYSTTFTAIERRALLVLSRWKSRGFLSSLSLVTLSPLHGDHPGDVRTPFFLFRPDTAPMPRDCGCDRGAQKRNEA